MIIKPLLFKPLFSALLLAGLTALATASAQDGSVTTESGAEAAATAEGQILIGDALANALVESGAFADVDSASQAIFDMRADGMGWGEIAQEFDLDLGPIVADAMSEGRSTAGLAIAEENRARGEDDVEDADAEIEAAAGAETAASARTQAQVGEDIAADARANARIDAGLRGSTSGRPAGVGAPILPDRVQRPTLPSVPSIIRPERPQIPQRGGRGGG